MNLLLSVAIGLVLIFVGVAVNADIKHPKLELAGSGILELVGSGFSGVRWHLRIRNSPGFYGITINETVFFGWQIWDSHRWGWPTDRNPAKRCSARLLDKETGEHLASLLWRTAANPEEVQAIATLGPGAEMDLLIFVRREDEPTRYFVNEPSRESRTTPAIPPDAGKLTGNRDFLVRVEYSQGMRHFDIDVAVRLNLQGQLHVRWQSRRGGGGGGSF